MALYALTPSTVTILRTSDGAFIPTNPANKDYQAYLAWSAIPGNTPDPVPTPTLAQQARAAMTAPIHLVCVSTTGLNADYPMDQGTRLQINSIATAIASKFGIPGSGTTFDMVDTSGVVHQWPQKEFLAYANTVRDYIYALQQVISGTRATMPSNTLTINAMGSVNPVMVVAESAQSLALTQASALNAQGQTSQALDGVIQYLQGSMAL